MSSYDSIIDYSTCAVHYIPVAYLFYNWKFVLTHRVSMNRAFWREWGKGSLVRHT